MPFYEKLNALKIFAGNKIDLEKNRHVSIEEAEEYAKSVGAKHVHTSAKLNKGIDDVFLTLTKRKMLLIIVCGTSIYQNLKFKNAVRL